MTSARELFIESIDDYLLHPEGDPTISIGHGFLDSQLIKEHSLTVLCSDEVDTMTPLAARLALSSAHEGIKDGHGTLFFSLHGLSQTTAILVEIEAGISSAEAIGKERLKAFDAAKACKKMPLGIFDRDCLNTVDLWKAIESEYDDLETEMGHEVPLLVIVDSLEMFECNPCNTLAGRVRALRDFVKGPRRIAIIATTSVCAECAMYELSAASNIVSIETNDYVKSDGRKENLTVSTLRSEFGPKKTELCGVELDPWSLLPISHSQDLYNFNEND